MRGHCNADPRFGSAIASQRHQLFLDFPARMWPDPEGPSHASAPMQGANQAAAAAMLEHPTVFIGQVRADAQWCKARGVLAAAAAELTTAAVALPWGQANSRSTLCSPRTESGLGPESCKRVQLTQGQI